MAEEKDNWSADAYQQSASFVPKLATKVVQWLDLQPDDVLLDVGCGDGILNADFAKVLAQGKGRQLGIDSSEAMVSAARDLCKDQPNSSFEVMDASQIHASASASLSENHYTKVFSNAALHWILKSPAAQEQLFPKICSLLQTGGSFTFEMGGLGNVPEMRTALLLATSRRIGLEKAKAAFPWFFPDETWISQRLEQAGFRVDRVEREWRPTMADKAGVEGWLRLFGKQVLDAVDHEKDREECLQEATSVLKEVCRSASGGEMISYVRLRCKATKV